jgi:hypothetical protein
MVKRYKPKKKNVAAWLKMVGAINNLKRLGHRIKK